MCDRGPGRDAIRTLTRKLWWIHYAESEFCMNISRNLADAESRNRIPAMQPGATLLFADTPITWRQRNSARARSGFLISRARLARLQSCARKRFGGAAIAH